MANNMEVSILLSFPVAKLIDWDNPNWRFCRDHVMAFKKVGLVSRTAQYKKIQDGDNQSSLINKDQFEADPQVTIGMAHCTCLLELETLELIHALS